MRDTVRRVLAEVAEHHEWQHETYGEANRPMPDGTGPGVEWLRPVTQFAPHKPITAKEVEALLRGEWDYPKDGTPEEQAEAAGECSWMRLLREEVAEAFGAESGSLTLQAELIQVAAVAVSWAAVLRERGTDGPA
jgi:hypothetical protein